MNGIELTLPLVLGAALLDSINPCAFAVLLTFIASVLVLADSARMGGPQARWLLWRTGLIFVAGVFMTYLALGLGLLGFASILSQTHWVGRVAAVGALVLGLMGLQEALLPEWGQRLGVPAGLGPRLRSMAARATAPAVFGAGVLVGLCTVPCSGAVYLAVLGLLAQEGSFVDGLGYLVLYNVVFVLPLLALLAVTGSRPVFNRLGRWQLHHRGSLKFGLGLAAVLLGLLLLATL